MMNVFKQSLYTQAKENAVHEALLTVGFAHIEQFKIYALYDKAGFTMLSIPEGNAQTFEQVIKFFGVQTFKSSLARDVRVFCGQKNSKIIEMANDFEEQQGAAILEKF